MKFRGTYQVFYSDENAAYGMLHFPPFEVENDLEDKVKLVYPNLVVPLSKVKSGELNRELAAIQRGEQLPPFRIELNQVIKGIKDVSRKFAQLIAEDPSNLGSLEWRDLERTMAEVLEGLGFSVELTPGSKDGGKDLIIKCIVSSSQHTYIVEIKHWRSGGRVGHTIISDFLNVLVSERRQGGLFLSTSGYCTDAFEMLSEIQRQQLKFGDQKKVVSLCKTYIKAQSGLLSRSESLVEVLFEETL